MTWQHVNMYGEYDFNLEMDQFSFDMDKIKLLVISWLIGVFNIIPLLWLRPIDSDSCYRVLISTSAKTASEALKQYRERNGVELYFDDEKNLLDLRRLKNHNEQTIRGKIFVTFISLILLAQLRKMVNAVKAKKRRYWSEHDMLRKVETYAKIHFVGKYKDVYTTPTSAQRIIDYEYKGNNAISNVEWGVNMVTNERDFQW